MNLKPAAHFGPSSGPSSFFFRPTWMQLIGTVGLTSPCSLDVSSSVQCFKAFDSKEKKLSKILTKSLPYLSIVHIFIYMPSRRPKCYCGGIGRHAGLKILFAEKASAGSIPAGGTKKKSRQMPTFLFRVNS